MYHYTGGGGQASSKHSDGPGGGGGGGPNGELSRLGGGGAGGGAGGGSAGGGGGGGSGAGGWGRHNGFVPGGIPLPVQSGYPSNGMLSQFGAPPGQHHGGPPHHHQPHAHGGNSLLHHLAAGGGGHPHHPSFGGGGSAGMHLGSQNGGMGMAHGGHGHGPGGFGGLGAFGAGGAGGQGVANSPPGRVQDIPMTPSWQHQLLKAESSRLSSSPHHRARSAAMASRMNSKPAAVTISDPNRPSPVAHTSALNGSHRKNTSLSVMQASNDRAVTPELSEASVTPNMGLVDPANPAMAPAPEDGADEVSSEPWTGLDLGGIRLKTLSPQLFSFSHITQLYINHNSLTSLPPQISQLRQLTLLDATANEISVLPPEIGVLCKLKDLLLFDNLLTTLPPEMGTLYKLETLGIDGNPLEDRLRKIIVEEGTSALITHFRDTCQYPLPPSRQFIPVEPDVDDPATGKQEAFTVLTYNILCPMFASASTYTYTPSWALEWNYRRQTILQELLDASADIVCLQEIDVGGYNDFFLPQLREHGYDGVHYPRSRAKTMAPDEARQVDGCATFWKTSLFKLVETQVIEFNQVAMHRPDIRTEDMFNRVMARDNIAAVAELEFARSGARVLVANGHIYWDHRLRDVKLVQIGLLMEELEKIVAQYSALPAPLHADAEFNNGRGAPKYDRAEKGRDIPLILCVDLNSLTGSAVYDFLSSGEIPPDHEDFMDHTYGQYTTRGLKHRLGLRSACASFGEMKMTNWTPTFHATIDYIFYTPRNLKVTSVLGDVEKSYLDKVVGFPNAHFPSDHIPVFATFRVKGQP